MASHIRFEYSDEDVQSKIDKRHNNLKRKTTDQMDEIKSVNNKLLKLDIVLQDVDTTVDDVDSKVDGLRTRISKVEESLEKIGKDVSALHHKIDDYGKKVDRHL
jgi:chromosome segregation ATPase